MAARKRPRASRGFRIGTVSSLTGIDPHTIRAWERRYGALAPHRSEGGARLYSDEDVTRLQLIKAAVDAGDAISIVAPLSNAELRTRLAGVSGLARRESLAEAETQEGEPRPLRLGVVGASVAERLRANAAGLADLEVHVAEAVYADGLEALRSRPVDILVATLEGLEDDYAARFRSLRDASGARHGVVIYEFARRADLAQLAEAGAHLMRGPLSVAALRRAVIGVSEAREVQGERAELGAPLELPADGAVPPPRIYTDGQIARLSEIASSVECECPNHLSALIANLVQFERYSTRCANESAEDAALHTRLALGTGRARALIEQLLTEVCHHDRIRL